MVHANPGLRPGLSSAVPPGLDFVMVVLTQTLKPSSAWTICGTAEAVPFVQRLYPQLVKPLFWLKPCPSFISTRENLLPSRQQPINRDNLILLGPALLKAINKLHHRKAG
jgi:hypothetical protein